MCYWKFIQEKISLGSSDWLAYLEKFKATVSDTFVQGSLDIPGDRFILEKFQIFTPSS